MVMVVPIAIAANVLRVFVAGLLAHYVSVDTALGVFHTAGGWSVFLIAAALLLGVEPVDAGRGGREMTRGCSSSARCCCCRPGSCAPSAMANPSR